MIGITEAGKQTGKTRQTIHKAIRNGRISAKKDDKGQWLIDPAELFRVFEPVSTDDTGNLSKNDDRLQYENKSLQREIEMLREQLGRERETITDLRQDRETWREQAERATTLLTHQQTQETRQPPPTGRIARAWAALTGKA